MTIQLAPEMAAQVFGLLKEPQTLRQHDDRSQWRPLVPLPACCCECEHQAKIATQAEIVTVLAGC